MYIVAFYLKSFLFQSDFFLFKYIDSKVLTEEAREKLFTVVDENKDFIGWMLDILSPTQISNNMLKRLVISYIYYT